MRTQLRSPEDSYKNAAREESTLKAVRGNQESVGAREGVIRTFLP